MHDYQTALEQNITIFMMTLRQQYCDIMTMPVGKIKRLLEHYTKFKEEEKTMIDKELDSVRQDIKKISRKK